MQSPSCLCAHFGSLPLNMNGLASAVHLWRSRWRSFLLFYVNNNVCCYYYYYYHYYYTNSLVEGSRSMPTKIKEFEIRTTFHIWCCILLLTTKTRASNNLVSNEMKQNEVHNMCTSTSLTSLITDITVRMFLSSHSVAQLDLTKMKIQHYT